MLVRRHFYFLKAITSILACVPLTVIVTLGIATFCNANEQIAKPEFRRHVLPILSKAGCNSGACHGALAGKGGFKLSLRGYNPSADFFAITRQARGRRIELADPGRSLLLAKPSGAIPHKGGLKLDPKSDDYKLIARWLTNGAPGPMPNDPTLDRLEVSPANIALKKGDRQQISVKAHYSNGEVEDVTSWARFSSSNETVVSIGDDGEVDVQSSGEGAIVAWFSSRIELARIASPFENKVDAVTYKESPRRNFIDELNLQKLASLNLVPSPRSSDAEFLRRVYLDAIGTLPKREEVTSFLSDDNPA